MYRRVRGKKEQQNRRGCFQTNVLYDSQKNKSVCIQMFSRCLIKSKVLIILNHLVSVICCHISFYQSPTCTVSGFISPGITNVCNKMTYITGHACRCIFLFFCCPKPLNYRLTGSFFRNSPQCSFRKHEADMFTFD